MPIAEIGDNGRSFVPGGNVPHDLAGLRGAVELIRGRWGGVNLQNVIAVHVSEFDLMHHRIGPTVQLFYREMPSPIWPQHSDHALVMGSHGDGRLAVAVN